jgi:hypothetical protein
VNPFVVLTLTRVKGVRCKAQKGDGGEFTFVEGTGNCRSVITARLCKQLPGTELY